MEKVKLVQTKQLTVNAKAGRVETPQKFKANIPVMKIMNDIVTGDPT